MFNDIEWHLWTVEQISDSLPDLIQKIESNFEQFPEEYREKNRLAIESLRAKSPTLAQIRDGSCSWHLGTLGFALDALGRRAVKEGNTREALELFQAAHEMFRCGSPSLRPNKQMRQILFDAVRVILDSKTDRVREGEIDSGQVLSELNSFVESAWGQIPPQIELAMNEMVLTDLERIRTAGEDDTSLQERLVRDNIETVLAIEIPTRLESIREHWEEIALHVAPTAVRLAKRALRRPEDLSGLLPQDVWLEIKGAIEQGDADALGQALAKVEDALETNLRLRLDAKAEFRHPVSELRYMNNPDRSFLEARELLLREDPRALEKFNDIHFRRNASAIAKEWYAYALEKFGGKTDIFEIIELLEDAISSEQFREDWGWTARWNLACALRKLQARADEALNVLLPVLDNDSHTAEVFELCLLWALEKDRDDLLPRLFLKSPYYEAHLLAALQDAETLASEARATKKDRSAFWDHFKRISRILRDPDHVFPDPKERLTFDELDQLTRNFIETSLMSAGIEWFRQRVSYGHEGSIFKNWECAARLNEEFGDLKAAWRCRRRQWDSSRRRGGLQPQRKTPLLRSLMNWAQNNGFEEEALAVLKRTWRNTSLTEDDVKLWEARLMKSSPSSSQKAQTDSAASYPRSSSSGTTSAEPKSEKPLSDHRSQPSPTPTLEEAERVIQQLAGSFAGIANAEALADRAGNAESLLVATSVKYPSIPSEALKAIREVAHLAITFRGGVDDQQAQSLALRMKDQLAPLRNLRQQLPFELHGLAQTCERVVQNMAVRVKPFAELNITTPDGLKVVLGRPDSGEALHTRIFARLSNPGTEEVRNLEVAFQTASQHVRFPLPIMIASIAPKEKRIVECTAEVVDEVADEVDIRVHVTYDISGIKRTSHATGRVPVSSVGAPIPVAQRYVTQAPVGVDRVDLFHGRERELMELLDAFVGGRMHRLYFVNGIRAVGKSSLMQHLGSRCGPDILPVLLNVQTALGSPKMTAVQFVRQLIRMSIERVQIIQNPPPSSLVMPAQQVFELDPPWVVFDLFLRDLLAKTGRKNVLIAFDEMQVLVKRIADHDDPMDDGFLTWLRDKIQEQSNILVICTGSEPYALMRKRYEHEHTGWRNMEAYNISFVEKSAMEKIATVPVSSDGVMWLPEALDMLWDMTEGHPWVTQILAERVTEQLNSERRRVVAPGDVDRAAERVATSDSRVSALWWNEKEGLVGPTHRQVAFLIIQHQAESRLGIPESQLYEVCKRGGIRTIGKYLEEMQALEVLTQVRGSAERIWRIRSAFLERHITTLMQREMQEAEPRPHAFLPNQPLALMLDWENVKIGLSKILDAMPDTKAQTLRSRLAASGLASRLLDAASRHGSPRQRWAVADWDRSFFHGDQKALKNARYWTDIAGDQKANASDHVLREKIHFVLREYPEIGIYVIGTGDADFHEAIKTLQDQGKQVILWSTRDSINKVYGESLKGPDRIQIEWLEDLVFDEESAT